MTNYKGQKYNPVEDDAITTESLFKVLDADTGKEIDVRELLGLTEEDFKDNPELASVLQHMQNISPLDEESKEPQDDMD